MSQLVEESSAPPRQKRRPRLRPRTRRGWIVAALVTALVLGGGGFAAWWFLGRSETPQTVTRTVTIEPTTLKRTLSAAGTLEPARTADLTFAGSGTVTAVNVAVGDAVTAGEALAAIDPAALQIALDSAKADLTAAQQTLADLEDSGASTAAIKSATATVQVKSNAVTRARSDLSTATLTAPFDGVVASVGVAVGESAGSGSGSAAGSALGQGGSSTGTSGGSSTAAIQVISQGAYTVSTSVSSADIASVKRGLQAVITVPGREQPLYGTVSSVAVNATAGSTSGTASFPVTIDVTGTQQGLFAGSSVTVAIVTAQFTDVVAVPSAALAQAGGATTVAKLVDGVATPTKVTTGETIDGSVIVTEGLAQGDQIQITSARAGQRTTAAQNGANAGGFPGQGMQPPAGFEGGFPGPGMSGGQGGSTRQGNR